MYDGDGDGDGDGDRDDADDGVIPHLKCDVEMEFEGPNDATMNKWAADVLRRLADRIEKDEFCGQDGHHPLMDNVGKKVGEVYITYDGELGTI
jgi:hypothetical protein